MKKLGILIVVVLFIANRTGGIAFAQRVDVFGGYSYKEASFASTRGVGTHGANVAGTWNLSRNVGIEGNLAWHQGSKLVHSHLQGIYQTTDTNEISTLVFGPKLSHTIGPGNDFEAFAHFMVGGSRFYSSTEKSGLLGPTSTSRRGSGFSLVAGGGLDWFHGAWGIRMLEVDGVRTSKIKITASHNNCSQCGFVRLDRPVWEFRFSSGLIWRWGKK
jgi:hypothetical protein